MDKSQPRGFRCDWPTKLSLLEIGASGILLGFVFELAGLAVAHGDVLPLAQIGGLIQDPTLLEGMEVTVMPCSA
jgi:hypothetical protein